MVILLACLISEKLTGKLKQFNIEWPSLEDFNVGTSTATELLPAPKTSDNTTQHQLTQTKNGDVSVKSTTKNITLTPTSQHSNQDTNAESRSCINQTDQNGSDRLRTPNIQSHHVTNSAGAPEDGAPAASNDDNNDRIHLVTGLLFHACDATEFSLGLSSQLRLPELNNIYDLI